MGRLNEEMQDKGGMSGAAARTGDFMRTARNNDKNTMDV